VTNHFHVQVLRGRDAVVQAMTGDRVRRWEGLAETAEAVSV
jgi:hypothetical protein